MDQRLAQIAPIGKHINITMSDGNNHTGCFYDHHFPFATFHRDSNGDMLNPNIEPDDIFLNIDQVTAVYLLED